MKRRLSTSCVHRGAPIEIQGDRDTWNATVWLPSGGTLRSSGHQRFADAIEAARKLADEAAIDCAYRLAAGRSAWERRERRALVIARWKGLAVILASIAYACWWLSEVVAR